MTSVQDVVRTPLIAAELRALRKGRGIYAPDLRQRIGPNLRELLRDPASDVADLRRTLASELSGQVAKLPDDLRAIMTASLALSAQTRQMTWFGERVSWLAERSGHNERTVLRRIDAAERLLAEEIVGELRRRRGRPVAAPDGWYLDEFRAVLSLDNQASEAFERRRIVAVRDGLTEVKAWLDVPRNPGEPSVSLEAKVICGGRLVRRPAPVASRFEFFIELPAPLTVGQKHEYEMTLRIPPGEQMRPHYIFTPEYQCDLFDLTVRFDITHPPTWVRLVRGETVRMFEGGRPEGELVSLDGAGEAHARFRNPEMYLGYGLQWGF
jgi:hypothetical protein